MFGGNPVINNINDISVEISVILNELVNELLKFGDTMVVEVLSLIKFILKWDKILDELHNTHLQKRRQNMREKRVQ